MKYFLYVIIVSVIVSISSLPLHAAHMPTPGDVQQWLKNEETVNTINNPGSIAASLCRYDFALPLQSLEKEAFIKTLQGNFTRECLEKVYDDTYTCIAQSANTTMKTIRDAVNKGEIEKVHTLLKCKPSLNVNEIEDVLQYSLLHTAIASPTIISDSTRAAMVTLLLQKGVNPALKDALYEKTALHMAVEKGYMATIDAFIKEHVDLSLPDNNGNTALHKAAEAGDKNVIKKLVNAKLDVNITNTAGETALHLASTPEAIKELLALGADAKKQSTSGTTPLMKVLSNAHVSEEMIKELLPYSDLDKKNTDGNTLLSLIQRLFPKNNDLRRKLTTLFLKAGANPNIRNNAGETPLYRALISWSQGGGPNVDPDSQTIEAFVDNGADVTIGSGYNTPAIMATIPEIAAKLDQKTLTKIADAASSGGIAQRTLKPSTPIGSVSSNKHTSSVGTHDRPLSAHTPLIIGGVLVTGLLLGGTLWLAKKLSSYQEENQNNDKEEEASPL